MPKAPSSKAVLAVPTVGDQWHRKRVSRKLDDRDQVLEEAIQLVEEWPAATYPYVKSMSLATSAGGVQAPGTIVIAGDGVATATASDITVSVNGADLTISSYTDSTGTIAVSDWDQTALSAGVTVVFYVRVDNVLCPPVSLTVVA